MNAEHWTVRLKVGDVVRARSGTLRVVRSVIHSYKYGFVRVSVTFAIQRCSWTGRCYTTYTGNDLVQMGFRPTRAKWHLRTAIDRAIDEEIQKKKRRDHSIGLTCCDVEGIP